MLSREANELLTRTGSGTPMGELFRRFWLPALLTEEIAAPDSTPVRLRILGEDLVAFRDTAGRVGIVQAYCPHKLAPLFLGRNEECGLRCVYHGWKFDVDGKVIDVPNIAGEKEIASVKGKVTLTAYPTHEGGGMVWVYMGPRERQPEFPHFEWTAVPKGHVHASRWLQRSNWAQGMEGEIDSSHVSFLHRYFTLPEGMPRRVLMTGDGQPVVTLKETDYGFLYGSRRIYEDRYYWRITQWLFPMYSCIPANPDEVFVGSGRAWVPVDDYNTISFDYAYRIDRPYTASEIAQIEKGQAFPPRRQKAVVELAGGSVIDTFVPTANKGNDYLIDRDAQRTLNYTGIWGVNEQDRGLQEYMPGVAGAPPGIVDRSREHLVSSDVPAVTARRRLIKMATDLQNGIEPYPVRHPEIYGVRAISKTSPIADLDGFLLQHGTEGHAAAWPASGEGITPPGAPG
jgi:phthalate 4,5-dioxygenase oxygenase subunit